MEALNFKEGERETLEKLAARLVESPWRWENLLLVSERPTGSETYRMVLEAIRDCVAIDDPNAGHSIWPGVRKLESSRHGTDREAARILANAAKDDRPPVEVNK